MNSLPNVSLRSIATAVPAVRISQTEVIERARRLFPDLDPATFERMMPVYANAGIRCRYSCVPPIWYERDHGWREKNRLFLEHAIDLLEEAAHEALGRAGLAVGEIDAIVSVSTTGIATPSLDALLMERLGTRRDVERTPLFGLGCAGGVIGLARAAQLARQAAGRVVLLVVVELCALTFRRKDPSKSNMIATALFGDGAAAAILQGDGPGLRIGAGGEHTWRDSLDVMGWRVEEDGLGVVFSRDIPTLTRTAFVDALGDFLAANDFTLGDMGGFIAHPGGAKVLDALEDAFGLRPGGLAHARSVLRDYGNMSAATVLFVLERALRAGDHGRMLLSALGPGFTAAFQILEAE